MQPSNALSECHKEAKSRSDTKKIFLIAADYLLLLSAISNIFPLYHLVLSRFGGKLLPDVPE
jgi:hypothetical protein